MGHAPCMLPLKLQIKQVCTGLDSVSRAEHAAQGKVAGGGKTRLLVAVFSAQQWCGLLTLCEQLISDYPPGISNLTAGRSADRSCCQEELNRPSAVVCTSLKLSSVLWQLSIMDE